MVQHVSRVVMELVSEVCETTNRRLGGPILADHFPVVGPMAIQCGALRKGEIRTVVPDRSDHEGRVVDAEWDPMTRTYRYFSLPARGWVTVPGEDLLNWDLDMAWFLGWIAGQFGQTLKSPPASLVQDHLWDLGVTRVGQRRAGLFFARRLHFGDVLDQIVEALRTRSGHPPGIVLTTSRWSGRVVRFPGEHRVVGLRDCLSDGHVSAHVDRTRVRVILGERGIAERNDRLVDYSQDFGWVKVNGQEFVFSGDKQKQVIGMLIHAWENGSPRLRTAKVLEDVDSTSRTLMKFFGSRKEWQRLIEYGDGYCSLRV